MVQYFPALKLQPTHQVFVPLCGKSNDIGWLLNQGLKVCGIELSESAVQALFENLAVTPKVDELNSLKRYQHEDVCVFVGDLFDLTTEMLGPVQAIYDRAALVALPPTMRIQYTEHLLNITSSAQQLLITFEYDQSLMAGPPHSVAADEIHQHYGKSYSIQQLAKEAVEGKLKKITSANEVVWHLNPN